MPEYIPSPRDWVREQVELYERSGGTQGTTLRDTGLPVIIVTNTGNKTGAIRKTPLMHVTDGTSYVLVGSQGGAPKHPVWVCNLRANPLVEIRDRAMVRSMRVREVENDAERARLQEVGPQHEKDQQNDDEIDQRHEGDAARAPRTLESQLTHAGWYQPGRCRARW